jgi:hypothetical protein
MTLMAELDAEPDETLASTEGVEPTSGLAWSEDDSLDEALGGSWRSVLLRAAAVLAFCIVAAVGVVVGWRERSTETTRTPPPVVAATQTTPPPAPTKEAVVNPTVVTTAMDSVAQKITPPPPPDRDTIYLDLLDRAGVTAPTKDKAISNGHLICRALDQGDSIQTVVTEVNRINPSLNHTQSDGAVHAAINAYCPQYGE